MATGMTDEEIAKTVKDSAGPTDEELDVVYARANAATPGPWRSTWNDVDRPTFTDSCDDDVIVEAVGRESRDRLVVGTMYYDGRWPACSEPNAAFIAAARADVPRLVDALRAARQRERELRSLAAKLADALKPFEDSTIRVGDDGRARSALQDADRLLSGEGKP